MLKACPHRCDNDGSSIFGLSLELLKAAAWGTGGIYVPGTANAIFGGSKAFPPSVKDDTQVTSYSVYFAMCADSPAAEAILKRKMDGSVSTGSNGADIANFGRNKGALGRLVRVVAAGLIGIPVHILRFRSRNMC
jgi:hypothetical protein